MYSISEFSRLCGFSIDTLRYYEKVGLLSPRRSASGHREYSAEDLQWAAFLERLRATGMPIRQMARYSKLREQGDCTMEERLALLRAHEQVLADKLQQQQEHLLELRKKISWYEEQLQAKESAR